MEQVVILALQLVAKLIPSILAGGAATTAAEVIAILEQAVPIAVEIGEALVTPIRNIIAALRAGGGAVTTEQLDQLDTIEAKLDADFDAAAEAAEAADAAAAKGA